MNIRAGALAALVAATSLAACAGGPPPMGAAPPRDYPVAPNEPAIHTQRADLYRAHAGAPINGFVGRVNDWTELDEYSLVAWTGVNRAYLLEVLGPCTELPWARDITFTRGARGGVYVFDEVLVLGRRPQTMPCQIREIRPVDAKAVKQAQKAERETRKGA